jgi:hypothetical protein
MEKGQRKKIIDDHDELYSEIEISKLLSNNKLQQYIIDVCTNFQKLFQRRKFLYLFLNSSVHRYVYFQKQKSVSIREKSKHTSE